MKQTVALSVTTKAGLQSMLDLRFGRTPAFLIVSRENGDWTVVDTVDNKAADAVHGAGGQAAAMLSKLDVDSVISGRYGPKAYQALEMLGIEMWMVEESVDANQALDALANGALRKMKITVY
jgi:predicted Fe-Mo cluster-binding NifX family protein